MNKVDFLKLKPKNNLYKIGLVLVEIIILFSISVMCISCCSEKSTDSTIKLNATVHQWEDSLMITNTNTFNWWYIKMVINGNSDDPSSGYQYEPDEPFINGLLYNIETWRFRDAEGRQYHYQTEPLQSLVIHAEMVDGQKGTYTKTWNKKLKS